MIELGSGFGAHRVVLVGLGSRGDVRVPAGMITVRATKQILILHLLGGLLQGYRLRLRCWPVDQSHGERRLNSVSRHAHDVLSGRECTVRLVYA